MLTFTHNVDALPNCPDFHSYTLRGDYVDCDGSTVSVGEYSANLPSMLKTLEYYLKDSEVEIVYETIIKNQ
jgi:hypothetical protein